MTKEVEQILQDKYSFMRQSDMGTIYDEHGCQCGDGWFVLLDQTCAKIQEVYDSAGKEPDIQISQIKEKLGTLKIRYRFDWEERTCPRPEKRHSIYDKIAEIVDWAEKNPTEYAKYVAETER